MGIKSSTVFLLLMFAMCILHCQDGDVLSADGAIIIHKPMMAAGTEPPEPGVNSTGIDNCSSDPCLNDATCISSSTNYSCECTEGFRGTHCETDIDECAENEQHCEHGASCHNQVGSFFCDCPQEYVGERCEQTFVPCNPDPCQNGGRCQVADDFRHECDCSEVLGFFGEFCEINIDDCQPNNCQNGGTCVDGVASFTCRCTSEYQGDFCQYDRDECRDPSYCQNGATCKNLEGGFNCLCSLGFAGRYCENNIDDCGISACLNGGTCQDLIAGFYCLCPPDREGVFCEHLSACGSNPCHHTSTCQTNQETGEAMCICHIGFQGLDCSIDVDECIFEPCEEGTCFNTEGSFHCTCNAGFSGMYCNVDQDECLSHPCLNGGTCLNMLGFFQCICIDGYSGYNCEIALKPCEETPCYNGGSCHRMGEDFACSCVLGYTGTFCETNIDECASDPCQNGGTCKDGINYYRCDFQDGTEDPCFNVQCTPPECPDGFVVGSTPPPGECCVGCVDECAGTVCPTLQCQPGFVETDIEGECCPECMNEVFADCSAALTNGKITSGKYMLQPAGAPAPFGAVCDMVTDGGGWTVILIRDSTGGNFYRDMADYEAGFGDLDGSHWLGLENLYLLNKQGNVEMLFQVTDQSDVSDVATYRYFRINNADTDYTLETVCGYRGGAGNALFYNEGAPFSARDMDNDGSVRNCAAELVGGWWYKGRKCSRSNPLGEYRTRAEFERKKGIFWAPFRGRKRSLAYISMKIRDPTA